MPETSEFARPCEATWDVDLFLKDPLAYFGNSIDNMMGLTSEEIDELQLSGLKRRFSEFRGRLPMLDKLADSQGINEIENINDVIPLLFDNAIYKSYPFSLITKKRFGELTNWLSKLTTVDLTGVAADQCQSLDDWITALERDASLYIVHTSGTSGTMSFIPWSDEEWLQTGRAFAIQYFQTYGQNSPPLSGPLDIDCIFPYFREGALVHIRLNDPIAKVIAGSEEHFHAAFPGRLSADLMLLATRRRVAAAEGRLDQLEIDPELDKRRVDFEKQQHAIAGEQEAFFTKMSNELRGKRVFMVATISLFFKLAEEGLQRGLRGIFSPDSVIVTGGGGKGISLPDNWLELTKEFFGVDRIIVNYGMSEISTCYVTCQYGNYHALPWIIPFILDPVTAEPYPRKGRVTGRFGFYDLLPKSRWAGFVTDDEVTIDWDAPCPCGQGTAYVTGNIQRFSDKEDFSGEEKLSCAATPAAYAEALDFLNSDNF